MASKKAGGSAKNGRDSPGQRLGIKRHDGQAVTGGNILVRQRGTTYDAGAGTVLSRDYTIVAVRDGLVTFEPNGEGGKRIAVYAPEERALRRAAIVAQEQARAVRSAPPG